MSADEILFCAAPPGLELALQQEAQRLGKALVVPGGVELRGASGIHRRANLQLRIASRVMKELARFHARDASALQRGLAQVRWEAVLPRGSKLALDVVSRESRFPARQLRDAVPSSWVLGTGGVEARLRAVGEEVTVSVDTTGELLHRRGYRQETSHAPLRETLAAGLLRLAAYDPAQPLWDPMCGSGTLVIEAALMALQQAPGIERAFAFEAWPNHDAAAWEREKSEARAQIAASLPAAIFASDLNAGALGVARRNARRAGVGERLQLFRHDATQPKSELGGPGLVIANLPYGKRVGADAELGKLYRSLITALRTSVPGWRVALFAADEKLLESLDVSWTARQALENGGIACTLVVGTLPNA